MTEIELHKRINNGDATAYQYLFSEYYSWLCNYVLKLSGNSSVSEDIVQEVFMNLWTKRSQIVINSSIKNYLFRSCHNEFLQFVKKEKRRMDFLDEIRLKVLFENYELESQRIHEERLDKLDFFIDQLPPKRKEIFIKNKLERKKYKEIAQELNISLKTVESQMSKALRFLREKAVHFFL